MGGALLSGDPWHPSLEFSFANSVRFFFALILNLWLSFSVGVAIHCWLLDDFTCSGEQHWFRCILRVAVFHFTDV